MTKDILVFSHIPKNAGTSVIKLLRSRFGVSHIDAIERHRQGVKQYGYEELKSDLRLMPWARSIAGHRILPWRNYREFDARLFWIVILRDPIKRLVSQYAYQMARYKLEDDFVRWKRLYWHDNPQVTHLAGEPDLQAAKQILQERIDLIGLVESIEPLIKALYAVTGIETAFNSDKIGAQNPSPEPLKRKISKDLACHFEMIVDSNRLDVELYEFSRKLSEKTLANASAITGATSSHEFRQSNIDEIKNKLFRNLVYKPYAKFF